MANNIRDRTCRQCGKSFPGGPRAWYCPSCRTERRREQNRKHKRNGPARPLGSTDLCVICGSPYTVTGGLQRYCPSCAPDAIRSVDNAQSRAWNAEHATPEYRRALRDQHATIRKCVVCGKSFRPTDASITCSKACAEEHRRRYSAEYEHAHRKEISARKRRTHADKIASMTPDELAAYRAQVNARARENYAKRRASAKSSDSN